MQGTRPLKHPALLRGHRARRDMLELSEAPPSLLRVRQRTLLPESKALWRTMWRSRVANTWDRESDLGSLVRYIQHFDRYLRYDELVRKMPLVKGSREQLRANPLAARMDALEAHLRELEERFGLTPLARIRLGVELAPGEMAGERVSRFVDDEDESDPRRTLSAEWKRA